MTPEEWHQSFARCLGLFLAGSAIEEYDERGRHIRDDNLIVLLNAHHENIEFTLPVEPHHARWDVAVDTSFPDGHRTVARFFYAGHVYPLQPRSVVLLVNRDRRSQVSEADTSDWPAVFGGGSAGTEPDAGNWL